MARLTTITGEQTDNVRLIPAEYRVTTRRPGGQVSPTRGTVTAHCICHRTDEVTHALVRLDGRAVPFCFPIGWLTRLDVKHLPAAVVIALRSPAHA